jgi:hypothetical protein
MTYDQPNEMLRFVWRNESFRFGGFGRVRNETDGRSMGDGVGRSGRSSCTKALEGGATRRLRPEERCAASRLEGRTEATNTFVAALEPLRLWSIPFDELRAGFRGRPAALQSEVW